MILTGLIQLNIIFMLLLKRINYPNNRIIFIIGTI